MRPSRVWATMLGCDNAVIEGVDWHQGGDGQLEVIARVRPKGPAGGPVRHLRPPAAGL